MEFRYHKSRQDVGQIFEFSDVTKTLDRSSRSMTLSRSRLIIEISDLTKNVGWSPRSLTSLWYLSGLREYFSYQNLVSTVDISDLSMILMKLFFLIYQNLVRIINVIYLANIMDRSSRSIIFAISRKDLQSFQNYYDPERILDITDLTITQARSSKSLILPIF